MAEFVFPNHTNHLGTLFGGRAMALMDMAAAVAATRYCRKSVVTAHSDNIDFKVPVKQGMLVEALAKVVSTGRTSLKVQVDMYAEDLLTGARDLCTTGFFVMVAIGDSGKPVALEPTTEA